MPASSVSRPAPALSVSFAGAPGGNGSLHVASPWLAGAAREEIFPDAVSVSAPAGLHLYRSGNLLLGHAEVPFVAEELSARTEALYRRILAATRGRHLVRMWNYVPAINATTGALENYRAFCAGRARAFEAELGAGFESRLPAASAVGSNARTVSVLFAAAQAAPVHVENPEQIPAYRYPIEHGPRSPSFARATVARDGARQLVFVSGTAAIKGHQTIAPGALRGQLDCTLDNLRLISRASGLGDHLGATTARARWFKVYLRHPEDLPTARQQLESTLLRPSDTVTYLHAAICRAALDIEIEVTVEHALPVGAANRH